MKFRFDKIFVTFITVVIVLAAVETVFRLAGIPYTMKGVPTENIVGQFDSELGWTYIPLKSAALNYGDRTDVWTHFNKDGLRIPHEGFEFDKNKESILLVGCSWTMGHGLFYEETFAAQLESLTDAAYQVVNCGVQAYGTDQSYLMLKRQLSRFNTKIAIYFHIDAHTMRNSNYDRRMLHPYNKILGTKPQFALSKDGRLYLKRKPVAIEQYVHSFLFDFTYMRLMHTLDRIPPQTHDLTVELMRAMKQYCTERNVHFSVLAAMHVPVTIKNKGFDVIDVLKNKPEGFVDMVVPGDGHPDHRANAHFARVLYDYLNEKDVL